MKSGVIPIAYECILNHLENEKNRHLIIENITSSRTAEEQIGHFIKLIENTIESCDITGSKKIMNMVQMRLKSDKLK